MADPNHPNPGGQKPFAEFLREAPKHQGETVSLTGQVSQSEKEGHFVLDLGGGQTVELPTQAVRSYKVAQEGGRQVQLELDRKSVETTLKPILSDQAAKPVWADPKHVWADPKPAWSDVHSHWIFDLKHPHKDPIFDPILQNPQFPPGPDPTQLGQFAQMTAGAVPFTLATAHQAPQSTLAMQGLSGQVKPVIQDVRTLASHDLATVKEPIQDTTLASLDLATLKEPVHDHTIKELIKEHLKDPIFDTVKEVVTDPTLVEGGGTIQEGGGGGTLAEGGGFPGQGGFNPGF
jgi:hypothetical protein